MGKELVPEEWGEGGGDACKNGEEVCLERLDHAFGYVAAVHVGRNELEGSVPLFFNLLFVGGAALVVEDLEVDVVAVLLEAGRDAVGGSKAVAVAVVARLERLYQDDVAVDVVGEHNEVVLAARADG